MTQTPQSQVPQTQASQDPPQPGTPAGVAAAVNALAEQTTGLVAQQSQRARTEVLDKLRDDAPSAALLGAAGLMSVFALVSVHRLVVSLLETRMSPPAAALTALGAYGAAAGTAAVLGVRGLRQHPAPVPADTARQTGDMAVDVRDGVRSAAS